MTRFTVWAPRARDVSVEVAGRAVTMEPRAGGHFAAEVPAAPGDRYGFRWDGGPIRPGPRSRRQPDGVHGLSAVVDPAAYRWGDGAWAGRDLPSAVIYELHIGTFTSDGTLDGAI